MLVIPQLPTRTLLIMALDARLTIRRTACPSTAVHRARVSSQAAKTGYTVDQSKVVRRHRDRLPTTRWLSFGETRVLFTSCWRGSLTAFSPGLVLIAATSLGAADPAPAEAIKRVAGKTLAEWTSDLAQGDLRTRLCAVRTLPVFAAQAEAALFDACGDKQAAVRFWALAALGDMAVGDADRFQRLLNDRSHPVRVAAAYATCRRSVQPQAIRVLQDALAYPSRGLPIFAADWLGKIGSPLATQALETAAQHKDYHIRNACRRALRAIRRP